MGFSDGSYYPDIHCPNCQYNGLAAGKPNGCLPWLGCLALFFIASIFWPLFIIAFWFALFLLFAPKKPICPKCTDKYVSIALDMENDRQMIDEALSKFNDQR